MPDLQADLVVARGANMNETCPFCGAHRLILSETTQTISARVEYFVRCSSCAAEGPWAQTPAGAIRWWNQRVPSKRVAVTVPEME